MRPKSGGKVITFFGKKSDLQITDIPCLLQIKTCQSNRYGINIEEGQTQKTASRS